MFQLTMVLYSQDGASQAVGYCEVTYGYPHTDEEAHLSFPLPTSSHADRTLLRYPNKEGTTPLRIYRAHRFKIVLKFKKMF